MKKDVMIKIVGTQKVGDESNVVEVVTKGSYYEKNSKYYIVYEETEATGFNGKRTILSYDRKRERVTMQRSGQDVTELIIEGGQRHQCSYATAYGNLMIGITGGSIESALNDDGGKIKFRYTIDMNMALASENSVDIEITDNPQI